MYNTWKFSELCNDASKFNSAMVGDLVKGVPTFLARKVIITAISGSSISFKSLYGRGGLDLTFKDRVTGLSNGNVIRNNIQPVVPERLRCELPTGNTPVKFNMLGEYR